MAGPAPPSGQLLTKAQLSVNLGHRLPPVSTPQVPLGRGWACVAVPGHTRAPDIRKCPLLLSSCLSSSAPALCEVSFPSSLLHHRSTSSPRSCRSAPFPAVKPPSQAGLGPGSASLGCRAAPHTHLSSESHRNPLQTPVGGRKFELLQSAAISRNHGHRQRLHLINHREGAEN